jgi:hypothetical protein
MSVSAGKGSPDGATLQIYITSTSPRVQWSAMQCKLGKGNQLKYAGFAILCNARQHPSSHS